MSKFGIAHRHVSISKHATVARSSCSYFLFVAFCFLQVSYAIGIIEPLSIDVHSYGTGIKTDAELKEIIKNNFDLRPGVIIR